MNFAFLGKLKSRVPAFVSGLVIGAIALYLSSPSGLWPLFQKIPATFWGVLIGAFFSLGGVELTNRAGDRRLQTQLGHDRAVKRRERELSMRKDVYLAAVEAFSAGFMSVARLGNLDLPPEEVMAGYVEKSPSISKVHVVASEDTVKAALKFTGELSGIHLRLLVQRAPLVAQKQKLAVLQQQRADFHKAADGMVELMKQYNLDGSSDQRRFAVIQNNFKFEQQRAAETSTAYDQLAAALHREQLKFFEECMGEAAKLSPLMAPIVVSIRQELDLPLDESVYTQILEEQLRKQADSLARFRASLGPKAAVPPSAEEQSLQKGGA